MIDFFHYDLPIARHKQTPPTLFRHGIYSIFCKFSTWGMVLSICCLIGQASLSGSAWADCQSSYKQAIDLLDVTTKKASQNEHPDADAPADQSFQNRQVLNVHSRAKLPDLA